MLPANRWPVRSRGSLLASALLLVLLAGPELAAGSRPSRRAHCFALPHAADLQGAGEAGHHVTKRDFDVYETSAIELDVYCLGDAPAPLHVQLLLPNGDTYETLEAVSPSPEDPSVARGRRRFRSPEATARFPVAGTFITQYGLVGTWSARVCWEEDSRPSCGRVVPFSLER